MLKAKRIGRPKLPTGRPTRGVIVPVRVAVQDLKMFEKVAKESNKTLSGWIRDTLITGAYRTM